MKIRLCIIGVLSLVILSCKKQSLEESITTFKQQNVKENNLFTFGTTHKGEFKEGKNHFEFVISIEAKNITPNIFEKTTVEADLELILSNGNKLTDKGSDLLFNDSSIESISFWKPEQTKIVGKSKELHTASFPNHFKEYPVEKAVLILRITAKDIVNNSVETVFQKLDITDKWKNYVSQKVVEKKEAKDKLPAIKDSLIEKSVLKKAKSEYTIEDLMKNRNLDNNDQKKTAKDEPLSSNNYYGESKISSGRKAIVKPLPKDGCNEAGTVVVEVTVDRSGNVISATPGIKGTTNMSSCLLQRAKTAALATKWESSTSAPSTQVGSIVYEFQLR